MNRTFFSEDARKTQLFEEWNAYLRDGLPHFAGTGFDEIYEGTAVVSEVSKNFIGLHLNDGRKLRNVPINPGISLQSVCLDVMMIVLGKRGGKWWPLHLVSVGSKISAKEFHITVNPLLMVTPVRNAPEGQVH